MLIIRRVNCNDATSGIVTLKISDWYNLLHCLQILTPSHIFQLNPSGVVNNNININNNNNNNNNTLLGVNIHEQ